MYWWITTISDTGRLCIFGPYNDESSANEYGFAHFGTNFEIEQLDTKDMNRATRILKKKRYDSIRNLDIALQRAKHKVGETKQSQRRRTSND